MSDYLRTVPLSIGVVAAVVLLLAGCTGLVDAAPSAHSGASGAAVDCGSPTRGTTVVIVVSGTAHEPRPSLTARAEVELRSAADSAATDGRNSTGSVAIVTSADTPAGGQPREVLPLTPRRANCEVEHGLQRDTLIGANITRVENAVADRAAVVPGLDLLAGIDDAVRGLRPGVLIMVSNGLSTAGGFDLRQVGWNEQPADLVTQLEDRKLLQGLLPQWRVLFTGLGATAGDAQPPLPKPARDTLTAYWRAICRAAAPGGSCTIDDSPLPAAPPRATADDPVVDVPGMTSAVGPDGRTTTTLSDQLLGFAPDSAVLSADAQEVLRSIGARIVAKLAQQPDLTITVRGYVADPPDSTAAGRQQTSQERAAAVAAFLGTQLHEAGLSPGIDEAGAGVPPGMTAVVNGVFDEAAAEQMRKVTVTY